MGAAWAEALLWAAVETMNTGQNVSEGIVVEAAAEAALAVSDRVAENPDLVRVDFVLHAEPEHPPAVADATAVAAGLG